MKHFLTVASILFAAQFTCGQTLFTLPTYRHIASLDYENDLFARTDRYYTQGIQLNYTGIVTKYQWIQRRALRMNSSIPAVSVAINHKVYTPSTILSDSALANDRPYAATLSMKFVAHFVDTSRWVSLSVGGEIGVVGSAAGGKQMQTGIHKATDNPIPLGWQHQISNGLIADVLLSYEKRFTEQFGVFQGIVGIDLRGGTFQSYAKPSLTLLIGNLKSYPFYFYTKSSLTILGYDGSLSGSLIGEKSEVTVPTNEINRLYGEEELGIRFQTGRIGGAFHYHLQTRTFQTQAASTHQWGGISLFVRW